MTTPVTPAVAPATRPAGADSGGADSAAPFASALDGALAAVHPPEDDADGEGRGRREESEGRTAGVAQTEPAPAQPGVVAALWALLTGTGRQAAVEAAAVPAPAGSGEVPASPVGIAVATGKGHVTGTAPGLAGAAARAEGGLATGLAGTAPAAAPGTVAPQPAVPGLPEGTTVVSVTVGAAPASGTDGVARRNAAAAVVPAALAAAVSAAQAPADTAGAAGDIAAPVQAPTAGSATATATAGQVTAAPGTGSGPDTGQGGGQSAGPTTTGSRAEAASAAPDDVAAGAVAATATAPATTPATTATATGPAATATAPPVAGQIAQQVAVLRGGPDGAHSMTVVLTPETLGTVEVSVTVSQGIVELTLRGAHEHGRAALVDALPDLRRDLEAAGLTCSRLDVDRGNRDGAGSAAQQFGERGSGDRGAPQERSEAEPRPWLRPADVGEGHPALPGTRTASSGVDVRV